jgi:HK97 family phage major capsid protein
MELNEIRDQINKLGTDMMALMAKAKGEQRELTSDEEQSFDRMDSDREKMIATERRGRRLAELETPSGRLSDPPTPSRERHAPRKDESKSINVVEGVRSWLLSVAGEELSSERREVLSRMGVHAGSRQMTFRLSSEPLPGLRMADASAWEQRALSTLNTSSPVDGYYTIENEMMRPLEEALLAFGGVRQRATVIRTETGAALPIPTDNDTANKGEIIDENTAVNEKDITFGQLVLNSFKYSSKMIRVSVELLQDASFPLGPYLGRKLGTRIGRIQNDHFTTGNGSTQPNGIVTASTASGTQLAAQTPTYAEMVSIEHSVDPAYRQSPGVGWMFHDTMLAEVKKIVDASTGRPIWLPNMIGGAPDTILGHPYTVNQSMAVAAGSGAGKSILFGDLSKYIVRDVREVTLVVADQLYAAYHQVAFLAFARADGDLLDAGTHPVKHALNKS